MTTDDRTQSAAIRTNLARVRERLRAAERRAGREPGSVELVAVSKSHSAAAIRGAAVAGQRCIGESYLQEAMEKIETLADWNLEWHFIGPVQANKTKSIAHYFDWVHSVDRRRIAERLSAQRDPAAPPLHVCLQVNVSGEASKSGAEPDALPELAHAVAALPGLRLRGLMTIPAPATGDAAQRRPFRHLRRLQEQLCAEGLVLDTLSMGMSDDLEAAILEGATLVRVGTAIFGPR